MNFYTDDAPGIKMSPVSFDCFCCFFIPFDDDARRSRFERKKNSTSTPFPSLTPPPAASETSQNKPSQSLVVMMSVGFIAFVTVLHIIGKGREREREREGEKGE